MNCSLKSALSGITMFLSVVACAQGMLGGGSLRTRRLAWPASENIRPLATSTASFSDLVQGAKNGNAESLYFLSLAVAKGDEVARSEALAFKYLQQSADAGNSNALFLVHLLMERETTGAWINNFQAYAGVRQDYFTCTNMIVQGKFEMADSNSVARLVGLYESDVQRGVLAATNEINRINEQFANVCKAKQERMVADEQRNRNTGFLRTQLGDQIEAKKTVRPAPATHPLSLRRSGLLNRNRPAQSSVDRTLTKLMPFPEAAQKAKNGEGAGLYAVALHYAKGLEIGRDVNKAGKYLKLAAETNDANAVFVMALVTESAMTIPQPKFNEGPSALTRDINFGNDNQCPNCEQYTDGLRSWSFNRDAFGGLISTNAADISKIRAAYKKAFSLGVAYATNELARFEKRVAALNSGIEKRKAEIKSHTDMLERNARLAEELLGEKSKEDEREAERRERARERERQLAIQEELRKNREARAIEAQTNREESKAIK